MIDKKRTAWYNCSVVSFLMRRNPTQREVELVVYIVAFIVAVAANVASHYICKWLDTLLPDNRHKDQ